MKPAAPGALPIPCLAGTLPDGSPLKMRPHQASDRAAVFARCQDSETLRWTVIPSPYTEEMLDEYMASLVRNPDGISWAVELDGAYAGSVDLRIGHRGVQATTATAAPPAATPFGPRSAAEIGYVTSRHARGRGAMSEAVRLVLDHGFHLGLTTIAWQAHVPNLASAKIAWRNGIPLQFVEGGLSGPRVGVVDIWRGLLAAEDPRTPRGDWESEVLPRLRTEAATARFPG